MQLVEELDIQGVAVGASIQGNKEPEEWGEGALEEKERAADLGLESLTQA